MLPVVSKLGAHVCDERSRHARVQDTEIVGLLLELDKSTPNKRRQFRSGLECKSEHMEQKYHLTFKKIFPRNQPLTLIDHIRTKLHEILAGIITIAACHFTLANLGYTPRVGFYIIGYKRFNLSTRH